MIQVDAQPGVTCDSLSFKSMHLMRVDIALHIHHTTSHSRYDADCDRCVVVARRRTVPPFCYRSKKSAEVQRSTQCDSPQAALTARWPSGPSVMSLIAIAQMLSRDATPKPTCNDSAHPVRTNVYRPPAALHDTHQAHRSGVGQGVVGGWSRSYHQGVACTFVRKRGGRPPIGDEPVDTRM